MIVGILLGLSASASWALANVVVQQSGRAVGALRALFWAQVVGIAIAALGSAAFDTRSAPITAAIVAWIGVGGVAALVAYVCLFFAFERGRLTLAVPILSSWAVLSSALSLALFHEKLTAPQLAGAAMVVAGAVVVAQQAQRGAAGTARAPNGEGDAQATAAGARQVTAVRAWLPPAVGAAIGFGILIPAMRRLSPALGPIGTIGVIYAADLALALPLAIGFRVPLGAPRGRVWIPIVLCGLFETAGSACITLGAQRAPLAIVSPLASLAAAFTVLYAWAFLGERPSRGVLVGAALASAGVVVLAF